MEWPTWSTMSAYDRYMLFIALVGKTFLILQVATVMINGSSENVSFTSYLVYFLTSLSWLVFGLLEKSTVITVSSFFGIIAALVAMNTVIIYKTDKSDIL